MESPVPTGDGDAEDAQEPREVVMIAFSCEPGRGSEPGVGYAFARAAAEIGRTRPWHLTLLTRPHVVEQIRRDLGSIGLGGGVDVVGVAIPQWLVATTPLVGVRIAYVVWQWRASRVAERVIRSRGKHSVLHHVTFASESLPTFEWRVSSAPRIFGPVGSSGIAVTGLGIGVARAWFAGHLRAAVSRRNRRGVEVCVAQNARVASTWRADGCELVVEPNIALNLPPQLAMIPKDPTLLVTLGVLAARKRHDLAIRVLAEQPDRFRLRVVGGGRYRARLERYADRMGVRDRVVFVGPLPRDVALRELAGAGALLHFAEREGAVWAVGEAQALGVFPVVRAGTGAEHVVQAAGVGALVNTVEEAVAAVLEHEGEDVVPSHRWDESRLPTLLESWYETAWHSWDRRVASAR